MRLVQEVISALRAPVDWCVHGRRQTQTRRLVSWTGRLVDEHYHDGELVGRTVHDVDWQGNPVEHHFDARGNRVGESRPRSTGSSGSTRRRWRASAERTPRCGSSEAAAGPD